MITEKKKKKKNNVKSMQSAYATNKDGIKLKREYNFDYWGSKARVCYNLWFPKALELSQSKTNLRFRGESEKKVLNLISF